MRAFSSYLMPQATHFKQVWTGVIQDLEISGEKENNLLEYSAGEHVHWEQVNWDLDKKCIDH